MAGEKIIKEMTIGEVLAKHPETISIFQRYNLHCAGCPMAQTETIEQATKTYDIDLNKFLDELNNAIKKASAV